MSYARAFTCFVFCLVAFGAGRAVAAEEAPASAGAADASGSAEDKQAVIRECVEAVLQILAQREER